MIDILSDEEQERHKGGIMKASDTEKNQVNLEYHKGERCPYTAVFCQEGFCSGCYLYPQWGERNETST